MVIRYGLLVYISLHFTSGSEVTHEVTGLPLLMAQLSLPRKLQELPLDIPKCEPGDRAVHHLPQHLTVHFPGLQGAWYYQRRCGLSAISRLKRVLMMLGTVILYTSLLACDREP